MASPAVDVDALKAQLRAKLEADDVDLKVVCFKAEPEEDALQRFLQARKFNVDAAAAQIAAAVHWRTEFASACVRDGKAACLGSPVEEVAQFYRGNYAGHCKDGRPIWYEQTGRVDIQALHCLTTDEKFTRFHVCLMEELQDKYAHATEVRGRTVNKTLSILDLEGLTVGMLSSETVDFVKALSKVDSDNYPETMGKMFIINSPGIFSFAWNIIKGFLDPRTVSKIEILGGPEAWKPRLAEFIEPDQLPAELDGTGPPCLPTHKCFTEINVGAGTTVTAEIKVSEGDSIAYKFLTRLAPISFKIVFVRAACGSELTLVPPREFTAEECSTSRTVSGDVPAPGDGVVIASWENTAWFGSRDVLYRLYKLDPEPAAPQPPPPAP